MRDWKFEPWDFDPYVRSFNVTPRGMAEIANAKLEEWLSTGVKVYTYDTSDGYFWAGEWDKDMMRNYEALLINIKPIERECEHEELKIELGKEGIEVSWPVPHQENIIQSVKANLLCAKCGKRLKATWQVIDE